MQTYQIVLSIVVLAVSLVVWLWHRWPIQEGEWVKLRHQKNEYTFSKYGISATSVHLVTAAYTKPYARTVNGKKKSDRFINLAGVQSNGLNASYFRRISRPST